MNDVSFRGRAQLPVWNRMPAHPSPLPFGCNLDERPLVLSFGCNGDLKWEMDIRKRLPRAEIHIFDPTGTISWAPKVRKV